MLKKITILTVIILNSSLFAEPPEILLTPLKYFVYTDSLRIRSKPSLQGDVIGTLRYGDVINVYEIMGSGQYIDGILDKWCRITDDHSDAMKWVNYFYIVSFPFKIDIDNVDELRQHNSTATNVYDELPESVRIIDIELTNNTKYFLCEIDDSSYYHTDLSFKQVVSKALINFIPESYKNTEYVKRYTKKGNIYIDQDTGSEYSYLPENAVYLEDSEIYIVMNGNNNLISRSNVITVLDNSSIRMYNYCENFRSYLKKITSELYTDNGMIITIISDQITLEYGIKIGMTKNELIKILGKPVEDKNNSLKYIAMSSGAAQILTFNMENNRIIKIQHYLEK